MCFPCCGGQLLSCCTTSLCQCGYNSINLTSSIATRITYAVIFLLNSGFAFLATTDWAIKQLENWSYGYLKFTCEQGQCYGFLAVHRICFALTLLHLGLALLVTGVEDTSHPRASIQNKFWAAKFAAWFFFLILSFFIPNGFFQFWGNYVAMLGATLFLLIQLLLLVDFSHTFAEMCIDKWEQDESNRWKYILISVTAGLFLVAMILTGFLFGFFAGSGCSLNQFYISFNMGVAICVSILAVHPKVQEMNPRSGLTQAGLVSAYGTYLVTSAIVNAPKTKGYEYCNPIDSSLTPRATSIVLGAFFTLVAIAYSTSRAATQSSQLISTPDAALPLDLPEIRSQAVRRGIEAGSLSESDLEMAPDDEKEGTAYSYSMFHAVFALATMYVAMLVTNWNASLESTSGEFINIGSSPAAVWAKIISGWVGYSLYAWTLLAPILLPDRYYNISN